MFRCSNMEKNDSRHILCCNLTKARWTQLKGMKYCREFDFAILWLINFSLWFLNYFQENSRKSLNLIPVNFNSFQVVYHTAWKQCVLPEERQSWNGRPPRQSAPVYNSLTDLTLEPYKGPISRILTEPEHVELN